MALASGREQRGSFLESLAPDVSSLYTRIPWKRGSFLPQKTQQVLRGGNRMPQSPPFSLLPNNFPGACPFRQAFTPKTEMALTYSPTNTWHLLPCSYDFCLSEHCSLASHMALCIHYPNLSSIFSRKLPRWPLLVLPCLQGISTFLRHLSLYLMAFSK